MDINFSVNRGECLGIAGISGNGQSELFQVLSGEIISEKNSIEFNKNYIGDLNPQERREYLMAFSPEDRLEQAAIPQMKIFENVALNNFKSSNFFNNGLINENKIKEHSKKIISDFNVNTDNIELKSQFLSGGNLQKLIIGRELITSPDLLICFNPTWGLDVGAINYIHETLIKINEQNKSIILISTDTDELLKLSDKISVIHKGKLSKIMNAEEVTSEKLGILMGGGKLIKIVKRDQPSRAIFFFTPVLAIFLTLVAGGLIFFILGFKPFEALKFFFIVPIADKYGFSELLLKATPLCLIAIGLSFCFKSNNWNIGAEGQLTFGAIVSGGVALLFYEQEGFYILPIVILAGAIGGMLYASIPAILKTYFNTNEILVSLMLVYVSKLILDYLVVGPWSNPEGFNFPETRQFSDSAKLPLLFEGLRIHAGIFLALAAVVISWFVFYKTYLGFQMKVSGFSLKTAKYAGYKGKKMIILVFLISGACAGLAGVGEITGPIGQLHREISPDYGFTAIIVAFLGRLHPVGIIFASLVVAITYLGAETAQIFMQIPKYTGQVFQGMILFFLLASDYLLFFKFKFIGSKK